MCAFHLQIPAFIDSEDVDEESMVMLSDILPTGFECGVSGGLDQANLWRLSALVLLVCRALLTAQFYSPAQIIMIDLDDNRLEVAKRFGATAIINSADGKAVEKLMKMTNGLGVDTAIEAVGVPATFLLCEDIVAPGGIIANIGVHGTKVDLHLERLWSHNISITTRLVDTFNTPMLLKSIQAKKLDPKLLVSHRFKFENIIEAYDTFGHAAKTKCLKVIIDL